MTTEELIQQAEEILHEPNLIDGLTCIHLVMDCVATGNEDLIKLLK
jgi:hypothetical protein